MVEVEEIELDLGLSIGGAFRKPVEKEKSKPELGQNQIQSNAMQKVDQNQQSPVKHESHAFKRKREQKNGTSDSAGGFQPVFKKEKTECVNGGTVSVNAPFHVLQLQQFGKVKFAPPTNGMQLPCWFGGEKNVGGIDGVKTVNGGDGKVKSLSNGSSSRCSSVVSDYQSSSREDDGGSTNSQSQHSANSLTEQIQLKNSKEINLRRNQPEQIASSKQFNNGKETQSQQNPMQPKEDSAVTSTTTATQTISIPVKKPLSLSQMPYVSTKGNGPNGKRVNGFLYRYSKCDEVSIVCVCHGSTFSPAEFVQHAGGTDISHPLRHITVNSSVFP
ncbi:ninja-family protein 6 [Lathyrus oleraceus]|uniref:Ninja-family protein n=1 Tax=Pisum sativum TaxID=3888 RepID=A0A9D4XM65_PEA|nr:ninja-family protein 6-like [Pisum sativum]KAI5422943.1 hypothetical protein KIW84_046097 [Pisum sativum]